MSRSSTLPFLKKLLCNALEFAGQHVEINQDEEDLIMHVRKSLLFHDNLPWVKKQGSMFDVTMGSYDGAEVCELVGLYILYLIMGWRSQETPVGLK